MCSRKKSILSNNPQYQYNNEVEAQVAQARYMSSPMLTFSSLFVIRAICIFIWICMGNNDSDFKLKMRTSF